MAAKKGMKPKAAAKKPAARKAAASQGQRQGKAKGKEPEGLKTYREQRANRSGKQK